MGAAHDAATRGSTDYLFSAESIRQQNNLNVVKVETQLNERIIGSTVALDSDAKLKLRLVQTVTSTTQACCQLMRDMLQCINT